MFRTFIYKPATRCFDLGGCARPLRWAGGGAWEGALSASVRSTVSSAAFGARWSETGAEIRRMAGGVGGEATTSVRWKGRLRRGRSSRADPLERAEQRRGMVGAGLWAGHRQSLKLRSAPACDRCVGDITRRQGPFTTATGDPNSLRAAGIRGKHRHDMHSSGLFPSCSRGSVAPDGPSLSTLQKGKSWPLRLHSDGKLFWARTRLLPSSLIPSAPPVA